MTVIKGIISYVLFLRNSHGTVLKYEVTIMRSSNALRVYFNASPDLSRR